MESFHCPKIFLLATIFRDCHDKNFYPRIYEPTVKSTVGLLASVKPSNVLSETVSFVSAVLAGPQISFYALKGL